LCYVQKSLAGALERKRLDETGTVTQDQEDEAPLTAKGVDETGDGYSLPEVFFEVGNGEPALV
jgi:hypothetical protein